MRRAAGIAVLILGGCSGPAAGTPEETTMLLTSEAFDGGGSIPAQYTCDGDNVSPPLSWSNVPAGAAAFVLVVDDPDAGGFVHWLLTDIPGDSRELPEGTGDAIGMPGHNDFGLSGWGGPCPPSGEHRYVFTLYALSEPIQIEADASAQAVREAIAHRLIGEARLTGIYGR